MLKITILTPTYNRGALLSRLYNSLTCQEYKNFEWIIVNDGSKDETDMVIQKFIDEGKIDIKYIQKENGGKPSAHNVGIEKAQSDVTVICDDDDYFTTNALRKIVDYWNLYSNETVVGMIGYREENDDLNNISHVFPTDIYSYISEIFADGIFDTVQIYKTDILKKNLFPVTDGEKFVPEIWLWKKLDKFGKIIIIPQILEIIKYREDGLTKTGSQTLWNNPMGYSYYFEQKFKESRGINKIKYYGIYKGLRKTVNKEFERHIILELLSIPVTIYIVIKCMK